jgi:hypothetical protein
VETVEECYRVEEDLGADLKLWVDGLLVCEFCFGMGGGGPTSMLLGTYSAGELALQDVGGAFGVRLEVAVHCHGDASVGVSGVIEERTTTGRRLWWDVLGLARSTEDVRSVVRLWFAFARACRKSMGFCGGGGGGWLATG